MSYAQLIKLEQQTDYYGSLYDQHKTDQYVKGNTRIAKFVNDPAVGFGPRVAVSAAGTYQSPDLITMADNTPLAPVSSLVKIGSALPIVINPTPVFVPLAGLTGLLSSGSIFVGNAALGRITAVGAQPGTTVRLGLDVLVLMTNPITVTDLMLQIVHVKPQSVTQEILCQENVGIVNGVPDYFRGASIAGQAKIESNQDYFVIYYATVQNATLTLQGISLCATIPV